ncbi:MAG TPA: 1-acyl-sn-glycerol-3-phosphate acyltransferase, partial [Candidatus Acidoferrales bacterium]|nr:1-acyl-sn-glycerol-3-phosphate acyltransferase [Candidatus Acidoferrales bacterium]
MQLVSALHIAHLGPKAIVLWALAAALFAVVFVLWLMPGWLLRLFVWLATHTLYRLDVQGRENIPAHGGALLVPNHASLVDGCLILASTNRFVRFLMFKDFYEHPLMKPFAKS